MSGRRSKWLRRLARKNTFGDRAAEKRLDRIYRRAWMALDTAGRANYSSLYGDLRGA